MSLPVDLTVCTVTGQLLDPAGNGINATVSFAAPVAIYDATGNAIISTVPTVQRLDSNGSFSVVLPCTDNSGMLPTGWGYSIVITAVPQQVVLASYTGVPLPHSLGSTTDLADILPPASIPVGAPSDYAKVAGANTWTGTNLFRAPVTVTPLADSTSVFKATTAAGAPVLLVDSTDARVGINVASPAEALDLGSSAASVSRIKTLSTAETDSSSTAEVIRMHFGQATFNGAAGGSSAKSCIAWYDDTISTTQAQVWAQVHNYLHQYDAQTFPASGVNTGTDVVTYTSVGIRPPNAWQVQFTTTGTLPGGLSLATNYYVKTLSSTTFSVYTDAALTSLVDLTTQGTGTHTMTPQLSYSNNHHQHFSIEVTGSDLATKNTRLSIPFGQDVTEIGTFQSNFSVHDQKLRIVGSAGTQRQLVFGNTLSDNLVPDGTENRWGILATSTAESGSNVGSNLAVNRYSDTGTFIDSPFILNRATGFASFGGASTPGTNLEVGSSGSGTVGVRIFRGANTNFGSLTYTTGAVDQWAFQMRNDSTNDFHFRDSVNGRDLIKLSNANGVTTLPLGVAFGRTTVADANYTVLLTDRHISYTSITAARVLTLPSVSAASGQRFTVKDESGSCSGTFTITVTPASGTIDGAANKVLNSAYATVTVYSNGTNWFIS